MEIKSILSMAKKYNIILALVLVTTGCAQLRTRSEIGKDSSTAIESIKEKPLVEPDSPSRESLPSGTVLPVAPQPQEPVPAPAPEKPRIGVVLGPGGLRSFAHIGVLQELERMKLPIHSIVGIEFASIPAAIYANKGFANEVEWQMFKLKETEVTVGSGILDRGGALEGDGLGEFYKNVFNGAKSEGAKYAFSCPAYNLEKQQLFWMARGAYEQLLPFCVSSLPTFKPFKANTAYTWSLYEAKKHLKSRGANFIVFVDILGTSLKGKSFFRQQQDSDRVYWSIVQERFQAEKSYFDYVISVPLQKYNLDDFENRREVMLRGQEAAQSQIPRLIKILGL